MAHHKKKRPKNRRAGCLLCHPNKMNGVKKRGAVGRGCFGDLSGTWRQEMAGHLKEVEQIAELGTFLCPYCRDRGCVWCDMPCPDGEHEWGPSDLEGRRYVRCKLCWMDGEIIEGKLSLWKAELTIPS